MIYDIYDAIELMGKKEGNCNTGDCCTCNEYLGTHPNGYCRTGNDTKRGMCCFHSEYQPEKQTRIKKAVEAHCVKELAKLLEVSEDMFGILEGRECSGEKSWKEAIKSARNVEVGE